MSAALEAERVRLEPLDRAHADALFGIYSEPEVARYLLTRPSSREEFDAVFRHALAARDSHGMWAVVRRDDAAVLGRVGFYAFGDAERPELAFLLSRSAWGSGLATEACRRALRYALDAHPWSEVVAVVHPDNAAAIRVLEKCAFSPDHVLPPTPNTPRAHLFQAPRSRLQTLLHPS